MSDATERNRILAKMLERLQAGLLNGPALNCRPQNSRQRIDLKHLEKVSPQTAGVALCQLLTEGKATFPLEFLPPPPPVGGPTQNGDRPNSIRRRVDVSSPYYQQQALMRKVRVLTEDARVYEQDTGADALQLGFPLVHLPIGGGPGQSTTRRLLAPLAFIPVTLNVKSGAQASVELLCREDKTERVIPNPSLLAWLEHAGFPAPDEIIADDGTREPWEEITSLARWLVDALKLSEPEFTAKPVQAACNSLMAATTVDQTTPEILPAAVLGLFPINNQALIGDTEAMLAGDALDGPVRSFIDVGMSLDSVAQSYEPQDQVSPAPEQCSAANERLVAEADPCQAAAVRLARSTSALVVHGPPGTGKSQTITNMVGDHLYRGQRVLVVSDKRTALDVVADRLTHLGLGDLVAVVHDARRDQRDLYRSLRDQLENLADQRTEAKAERELSRIDRQLDAMHRELSEAYQTLHAPIAEADEYSFHELMGNWREVQLSRDAQAVYESLSGQAVVDRLDLEKHGHDLYDAFSKADGVEYGDSAWAQCVGISLDDLLAHTGSALADRVRECMDVAAEADRVNGQTTLPFDPGISLTSQVQAREDIAELLNGLISESDGTVLAHWPSTGSDTRKSALSRLRQAASLEAVFREAPLETELVYLWGPRLPQPDVLARQVDTLSRYLDAEGLWGQVVAIRWKWESGKLLRHYGLPAGRASAVRLRRFLKGVQARQTLWALHQSLIGSNERRSETLTDDDRPLLVALNTHHRVLDLFNRLETESFFAGLTARMNIALVERDQAVALYEELVASRIRAETLSRTDAQLRKSGLFAPKWLEHIRQQLSHGKPIGPRLDELFDEIGDCEQVVRIHDTVSRLPEPLIAVTEKLLHHDLPAEENLAVLDKLSWETAIRRQLANSPELVRLDGQRLSGHLTRYQELRQSKHSVVRAAVLHHWIERQKARLLTSTRSRLSSAGAEVRRRLALQGNRSLRLRKVIEIGRDNPDGDPLFDLRPVWMASPETVAQVFPRLPHFDVIIFDEASQCRLEEALPILTRGRRVVIAGDTKQLPPTRFFETNVATSEDEQAETEQDWFELQQREVEDLLAGALNLEIDQCYLDVHYRSNNAALINFSNHQFYGSRLQPIPGHPRNRTRLPPITLRNVPGVYEDRSNRIEAEEVCRVVRDLLKRAEPPSIGIACFNTDQRDLVVECLDELAAADAEFSGHLAVARSRKGTGSSEGLFVKNLENVQGDERDHIIISTTYGPDEKGKFYRRFGPLGRVGGGRRLNVLVTRARHEIHLISSIPPSVYRNPPPLAPGQTPNGAWLLFSYLVYAEQLADVYREQSEDIDARDRAEATEGSVLAPVRVSVQENGVPSLFAESLAHSLSQEQRYSSIVCWGNDGFCVDLAIGHPHYAEDVTIGVQCDFNRYTRAADPVEWELFRTYVLEQVGWQLERVWTPQYFRDAVGVTQTISAAVTDYLAQEEAKDAIRVDR